jgi:type VI protein secretion system component VasK
MTPTQAPSSQWRRAHRTFWGLLAVAVIAAGSLSSAADAPPGPSTAVRVAISGAALIVSVALAGRVFVQLERVRRTAQRARKATETEKPPNRRKV